MAIDWTPVPGPYTGLTGVAEYRVENNGLVRWRGNLQLVGPWVIGTHSFTMPAVARPKLGQWPFLLDWAGGNPAGPVTGRSFYSADGITMNVAWNGWPIGVDFPLTDLVFQGTPLPAPERSLAGVLTGLKEALQNIAKLRVYDFPSSKVEPPAAVLSLPETPYDVTLGGRADEWTLPLWILVSKGDDRSAYAEITQYLEAEGERSIRAMIEADRTLGGACDTCAVINARPQFASVGGVEFLAIEFTLEVYT